MLSSVGLLLFSSLSLIAADTLRPESATAATPTAHWSLDETSGTRNDSIGSSNLSVTGTVGSTAGQESNAANFTTTGGSNYLSVSDNAAVSTGGETSFSLSMWVKLHSKSGTQVFVGKYGGANGEYAVYYEHTFKRFVFSTYSPPSANNYVQSSNTLGEPAIDTWYHITAIHDAAANTNSITVNGSSNTVTNVPEHSDTSASFVVGSFNTAGQYPAQAAIDDLRLYKTALTTQEVKDISQPPSNLMAYWKFDEGSGATANDSSGNGHNGTISNTSYSSTVPSVAFSNPHSLYFNPSNSGRIVSTDLQLNGLTEFTVAGWAYPTAATTRASWFGQNDMVEFGFTDSNTLFCYTAKGEVSWDFNPSTFLNNWHNITCLGSSSSLTIYIDGVNVASTSVSAGSYGSSSDHFSIGAGAVDGGTQGPFSGYIDDVRVYDRALTPQEMNGLGSGQAGPGGPEVPTVAIGAPAHSSTIRSWDPVVNWGDSDVCEYSWNNSSWTAIDCAEGGSDIPAPTQGSNRSLYVRASYTDGNEYGLATSQFNYDTTAPTVDAGSNRQTNSTFAQSSASASDSGSGIASYAWSKQSGPGVVTFSNSSALNPAISSVSLDGTYSLRLTVTDNAGNVAYDDFALIWDTTDPDVILDSFPNAFTKETTANFAFHGTDSLSSPVSFTCKLDSFSFNSCTSPHSYSGLAEGAHSVTVRATDQASNSAQTSTYHWTIDTTAPTISRNGSANVTIVQGQTYADAGATATDSISGNLTSSIVRNNPVNTAVPGIYTVTYNVSDQAGNVAAQVTRSVTVVSNADLDGDGTADAIQPHVAEATNPTTGSEVIAKVDDSCSLTDVSVKNQTQLGTDANFAYPLGLLDFTAECDTAGFTTTVTQYYYDPPAGDFVLRKFMNGSYQTVDGAAFSRQSIDGRNVLVISYQATDGGALDADGAVNGVIVDPAGPGSLQVTADTQASGDSLEDTGASLVVPTLLAVTIITSATYIRTRRADQTA